MSGSTGFQKKRTSKTKRSNAGVGAGATAQGKSRRTKSKSRTRTRARRTTKRKTATRRRGSKSRAEVAGKQHAGFAPQNVRPSDPRDIRNQVPRNQVAYDYFPRGYLRRQVREWTHGSDNESAYADRRDAPATPGQGATPESIEYPPDFHSYREPGAADSTPRPVFESVQYEDDFHPETPDPNAPLVAQNQVAIENPIENRATDEPLLIGANEKALLRGRSRPKCGDAADLLPVPAGTGAKGFIKIGCCSEDVDEMDNLHYERFVHAILRCIVPDAVPALLPVIEVKDNEDAVALYFSAHTKQSTCPKDAKLCVLQMEMLEGFQSVGDVVLNIRKNVQPNRGHIKEAKQFVFRAMEWVADLLLGRLLPYGFSHCDLHSGNVVYHPTRREFRMIDFGRSVFLKDLDPRILEADPEARKLLRDPDFLQRFEFMDVLRRKEESAIGPTFANRELMAVFIDLSAFYITLILNKFDLMLTDPDVQTEREMRVFKLITALDKFIRNSDVVSEGYRWYRLPSADFWNQQVAKYSAVVQEYLRTK